MSHSLAKLEAFLAVRPELALVRVREAKGSTPREAGTWMLVGQDAIFGTIGGGQLEFMAIEQARALIAGEDAKAELDVPLGPEIGQCCGGRVGLDIALLDRPRRRALIEEMATLEAARPSVFLFGGGHVGVALAGALCLMPVKVTVVETRQEALQGLPDGVERRLLAMPEEAVRTAPPGSAFVVLTHDHALDFLIAGEALRRNDAAYVGMIGSRTKRATFASWFARNGGDAALLERLHSPIGGEGVRDKRPAVIATLAAAEIATALFAQE